MLARQKINVVRQFGPKSDQQESSMTLTLALMLIAVAWLSYANGANVNFKGVATLFASHTVNYETAIRWAMIA